MASDSTRNPQDRRCMVGPMNRTWAIFLISVLGLFLELMLIRWIGTEVRIFAYLQNTVLIVCFLGLGLGCFTSRKPIVMRRALLSLLALTAILTLPLTRKIVARITDLLSVLADLLIWQNTDSEGLLATAASVIMGLSLTLVLMVLIWEVFVPLGRLLGRLMDDHPHTIWAYSVNVFGSLIGIWLFVALSVFSTPPAVWLLVAGSLFCFFLGRGREQLVNLGLLAAMLAVGGFFGCEPGSLETAWSPYQKLVLRRADSTKYGWTGKSISVNNTGYQAVIDLSEATVSGSDQIPADMRGFSQYDVPLRLKPHPDRVLIVGAGAGNDAAGALRGGAGHVEAVEIDPAIIDMGRRHHPERPYDSPKVTVVNDDARSFFAKTKLKYDLIIFGLLDSHTTTAMTNARLDHYVYTRESIERARKLLQPGGVMVLSFEAVKPYIADRMARCVREVFQQEPLTFRIPANSTGWGGVMFVAGDEKVIAANLAADQPLADKIAQWQAAKPVELTYRTALATDDWPYIYLETPRIPTLYYLLAGLMLVLLAYGKGRLQLTSLAGAWRRSHWHFFFLGAAFLLLEVQNISKACVVLGNTWLVNAVIISGILAMILLANVTAARFPQLPKLAAGCLLIGACLTIYSIDLARFGFLPYAVKAVVVGGLTTLPMLFAGIIFIDSFARSPNKDGALGANLIGALVGGVLQSLTFATGIKALLLVVAALYLAAMFTRPNERDEKASDKDDRPTRAEEDTETIPEDQLLEPAGV